MLEAPFPTLVHMATKKSTSKMPATPSIGQGHFIHALATDGTWRVAIVDEWVIGSRRMLAPFDAVHPDGSLDCAGAELAEGHLPVDLGRADRFYEARAAQCSAIDDLWDNGAGARILDNAPARWRTWANGALPPLIRAKAAQRLFESAGASFDQAAAELALAGALQENIEIAKARMSGLGASDQEAIDAMDAATIADRAARRKAPKRAASA